MQNALLLLVKVPIVVSCRLSPYEWSSNKAGTGYNYIQFISPLVAYSSLLATAALSFMSYSWLPRVLLSLLCQSLIHTAISLSLLVNHLSTVLGSCSTLYAMTFAMPAGIASQHFACQDSMSNFVLACWDSVSSFPGLWLAIVDWCLPKGVCCKPGHHWWIFIICTVMGS